MNVAGSSLAALVFGRIHRGGAGDSADAADGPRARAGRAADRLARSGRGGQTIFARFIHRAAGAIRAQVIGFRDGRVLLMPLEETDGLQAGDTMVARPEAARVEVVATVAGTRAGWIRQADGRQARRLTPEALYDLYAQPPGPLEREHITEPLVTGVRAIDSLLPIGKGQRVGIFGGSGVGKSTLLGAMARHNSADVSVIALIGERNREVREFLEKELSAEGLKRSVVVVATSDMPAPLRIRAGFVALAVAEYFRDRGQERAAGDGLGHAAGHGAARNRSGGGRASQPERLHAERVRPAAENVRTRGQFHEGLHHGLLHGTGGRRRLQRADFRCRARDSGRPHYLVARSWERWDIIRRSTF